MINLSWLLLPPALLLTVSLAASATGFVVQAVERQERFAWGPGGLSTVARETVARCLFTLLRPVAWVAAAQPTTRGAQTPVLLVPSPAWSRSTLTLLNVFLRNRGHTPWPIDLGQPDHTLDERAEIIEAAILALCTSTESERVDVVAHGLGGLAAAWALRHGDARHKVRRLVTLGTPWRGTRMAVFFPGPSAQEAHPGTHHLDDLTNQPVPTMSIWCPDDPVVIPARSAVADDEHCVAIEHAGHVGLMVSARAFHAVHTSLTTEHFGDTA